MVEKEYKIDEQLGDFWSDKITIRITATQNQTGFCHFNQWTIITDPSVIEIPEGQDRELWEFIPNMEKECLEFNKIEEEPDIDVSDLKEIDLE